MSKMKPEKSRIKSDILLRVRLLYILFILAGLLIFARLVWVQLFSSEVAYNAERLAGRIFTEQIIPAQRGNILTRDGDPLATSIFRYRVEFDFGSPGLDSVRTFHEQSDSLSKLLAAYFGDRSAAEYRRMFRTQHAKHYQVKYRKDTLVPRSEGRIARWIDRILDREFVPKKLYDTLRDHTPVQIFPRDIDYTEWETLRKYPLLNWNMGMVYNLRESDERIYPQGELGRRTIGLTGDRGNYGIEAVYREELAGRDGRATRQRPGFLRPRRGRRQHRPDRRTGRGHDARSRCAGRGEPLPARTARSPERHLGYHDRDGGPHGRNPRPRESGPHPRRRIRRAGELRHRA